MTRPDVFGLFFQLSLDTCIQATRNPSEDRNYLLARITSAYWANLDRPLPFRKGEPVVHVDFNGWRRVQAQETLVMARMLAAH